jgi:hypothetical protein
VLRKPDGPTVALLHRSDERVVADGGRSFAHSEKKSGG